MKIKTGKCRACYVSVFEMRYNQMSGKDEYSMCLLIPKTDAKTVKAIQIATAAAIDAEWGDRPPAKLRLPLRDGDVEREGNPTFRGCYFVNVKSTSRKPEIVDMSYPEPQPVLDREEFVSGDYCRATLNSFAYDKAGSKGVSFGLNNIQVICKGAPLGGGGCAQDDFKDQIAAPLQTDTSEWG